MNRYTPLPDIRRDYSPRSSCSYQSVTYPPSGGAEYVPYYRTDSVDEVVSLYIRKAEKERCLPPIKKKTELDILIEKYLSPEERQPHSTDVNIYPKINGVTRYLDNSNDQQRKYRLTSANLRASEKLNRQASITTQTCGLYTNLSCGECGFEMTPVKATRKPKQGSPKVDQKGGNCDKPRKGTKDERPHSQLTHSCDLISKISSGKEAPLESAKTVDKSISKVNRAKKDQTEKANKNVDDKVIETKHTQSATSKSEQPQHIPVSTVDPDEQIIQTKYTRSLTTSDKSKNDKSVPLSGLMVKVNGALVPVEYTEDFKTVESETVNSAKTTKVTEKTKSVKSDGPLESTKTVNKDISKVNRARNGKKEKNNQNVDDKVIETKCTQSATSNSEHESKNTITVDLDEQVIQTKYTRSLTTSETSKNVNSVPLSGLKVKVDGKLIPVEYTKDFQKVEPETVNSAKTTKVTEKTKSVKTVKSPKIRNVNNKPNDSSKRNSTDSKEVDERVIETNYTRSLTNGTGSESINSKSGNSVPLSGLMVKVNGKLIPVEYTKDFNKVESEIVNQSNVPRDTTMSGKKKSAKTAKCPNMSERDISENSREQINTDHQEASEMVIETKHTRSLTNNVRNRSKDNGKSDDKAAEADNKKSITSSVKNKNRQENEDAHQDDRIIATKQTGIAQHQDKGLQKEEDRPINSKYAKSLTAASGTESPIPLSGLMTKVKGKLVPVEYATGSDNCRQRRMNKSRSIEPRESMETMPDKALENPKDSNDDDRVVNTLQRKKASTNIAISKEEIREIKTTTIRSKSQDRRPTVELTLSDSKISAHENVTDDGAQLLMKTPTQSVMEDSSQFAQDKSHCPKASVHTKGVKKRVTSKSVKNQVKIVPTQAKSEEGYKSPKKYLPETASSPTVSYSVAHGMSVNLESAHIKNELDPPYEKDTAERSYLRSTITPDPKSINESEQQVSDSDYTNPVEDNSMESTKKLLKQLKRTLDINSPETVHGRWQSVKNSKGFVMPPQLSLYKEDPRLTQPLKVMRQVLELKSAELALDTLTPREDSINSTEKAPKEPILHLMKQMEHSLNVEYAGMTASPPPSNSELFSGDEDPDHKNTGKSNESVPAIDSENTLFENSMHQKRCHHSPNRVPRKSSSRRIDERDADSLSPSTVSSSPDPESPKKSVNKCKRTSTQSKNKLQERAQVVDKPESPKRVVGTPAYRSSPEESAAPQPVYSNLHARDQLGPGTSLRGALPDLPQLPRDTRQNRRPSQHNPRPSNQNTSFETSTLIESASSQPRFSNLYGNDQKVPETRLRSASPDIPQAVRDIRQDQRHSQQNRRPSHQNQLTYSASGPPTFTRKPLGDNNNNVAVTVHNVEDEFAKVPSSYLQQYKRSKALSVQERSLYRHRNFQNLQKPKSVPKTVKSTTGHPNSVPVIGSWEWVTSLNVPDSDDLDRSDDSLYGWSDSLNSIDSSSPGDMKLVDHLESKRDSMSPPLLPAAERTGRFRSFCRKISGGLSRCVRMTRRLTDACRGQTRVSKF